MSAILIVDDQPICREPIADALRCSGHKVRCAGNGSEALAILREWQPELMLLDIEMPELDGMAVLRIVRRNPDYKHIPVIMVTNHADKASVLQAADRGIQGYLLKSKISVDIVVQKVSQCLAQPAVFSGGAGSATVASLAPPSSTASASTRQAADAQPLKGPAIAPNDHGPLRTIDEVVPVLNKEDLLALVREGLELRPLGTSVENVLSTARNASCSAEDVAKALANDQAMCIRVLSLANSSTYARGRPVNSVQDAVKRIGIKEVRNVVLALDVVEQYKGSASRHVDVRHFWEHSLACALIASSIAKACKCPGADDCFLWGLLHDVGRAVLLDKASEPYARVWEAAEALELPLEDLEARVLSLDHCDILERALEHWKFHRDFIIPVVSHHKSAQRIIRLSPSHAESAAIVALANRVAHALLLGSSGNETIYPFGDLLQVLKLKPADLARVCKTVPQEVDSLKFVLLSRAREESWPSYAESIKARLGLSFRPLCVSRKIEADAFCLFGERLSDRSKSTSPNVGVLYAEDAREWPQLRAEYENREAQADVGTLPVMVICNTGSAAESLTWSPPRDGVILKTPVRITTFVNSVQTLLQRTAAVPGAS